VSSPLSDFRPSISVLRSLLFILVLRLQLSDRSTAPDADAGDGTI
jgi:hypothetical protein